MSGDVSGDVGSGTNSGMSGDSVSGDGTSAEEKDNTVGATAVLPRAKRRRRASLIALAVLALVGGAAGSWAYNRGVQARQDDDTAIIRAAMDPSTYVAPGDYNSMTVPIRNDGPYAVTIVGVYLPSAPRIQWNSAWTVIQPGATVMLHVKAPSACAAIPHTLKHPGAVPVLLRVLTKNGDSHASLRTSVSGVLQYAADYCATPTPTKKKASDS